MNINSISMSDKNPSFGIRYSKPQKWHPEVLKTMMDSQIVREIDKKYPKAIANYFVNGSTGSIRTLNFQLRNDMDIDILACSIFEPNAIENFCERIRNLRLSDIEKHFPFRDTKYSTNEVEHIIKLAESNNYVKEEELNNPIARFFRFLFNSDARAERKSKKALEREAEPIDIDIDAEIKKELGL